jgi:methyl-accepting chemotaxis protein
MTRGTRGFLNFMFFVAVTGGGSFIVYSNQFVPEVATFGPSAAVVIFALIVAIAQKAGADGELSDHYADSVYFLGFLFTLVSLATLFYRLGEGGLGGALTAETLSEEALEDGSAIVTLLESQRMTLSTRMLEETFSLIGVAVTTSIAGVLMRNMVRSWFLKNHAGGTGDMEQAVTELKKIAEGMSGGFADSMQAIGEYFEERKDLAGQIRKKEKAYLSGLENFTESMDRFAGRLNDVEKNLAGSSETMATNLKVQADGIAETDASLRAMAAQLKSLKADSAEINLKKTTEEVAAFNRETSEFTAVLDSLIDIVEKKVDTLRRAG